MRSWPVVLAVCTICNLADAEPGDLYVYGDDLTNRTEGAVHVLSLETPEQHDIVVHGDQERDAYGHGVAFGTDGQLYVADATQGLIYRFDPDTGRSQGVFATHEDINRIYAIAFGPDGDLYASSTTGSQEGNAIYRFDGVDGEFVSVVVGGDELKFVSAIGFSPTGELFVVCGNRRELRWFDPESGKMRGMLSFGDDIKGFGLAFGGDGSVYIGRQRSIEKINTGTGEVLESIALDARWYPDDFVVCSDGSIIVAAGDLLRIRDGVEEPELLISGDDLHVTSLAVRPESR